CGSAAADDDRLTEPDVIQLSLDAMNGKKSALRRLEQEYRTYQDRIDRDETLSDREQALLGEIEDTLRLQAPGEVKSRSKASARPGPGRSVSRSDFLRD